MHQNQKELLHLIRKMQFLLEDVAPTVGSFVEYEKDEEEEEDPEENQDGYYNSPDNDENDTKF